jgi:hypothetical protein
VIVGPQLRFSQQEMGMRMKPVFAVLRPARAMLTMRALAAAIVALASLAGVAAPAFSQGTARPQRVADAKPPGVRRSTQASGMGR